MLNCSPATSLTNETIGLFGEPSALSCPRVIGNLSAPQGTEDCLLTDSDTESWAEGVRSPGAAAGVDLVNVLHLINGEHFAGAERVQQHLGLRLERFGYTSHFVCLKPGKFPELCGLPADRVHAAHQRSRFDRSVIDRVVELARRTDCRLLHAHTPRAALIAAFAAHRANLPWAYHIHSPAARDTTRGLVNRVKDIMERFSIASCGLLITVSRSLRREMLQRGVARRRLVAIANGVAAILPINPAERLETTTWRLGLVALMRPRKGVEVALDALAKLRQRGAPLCLDLIGGFETADYERLIRERIESLGLSNVVRLCGFTRDVPAALRQLDALVLPSLFGEGMPMVVLEALSAGVPVVATRVEGTPEVIRHGVEGLLAKPCDADDLACKIDELIASRDKWAAMSKAAVARHRSRFSDIEMARRTARAYRRVCKS